MKTLSVAVTFVALTLSVLPATAGEPTLENLQAAYEVAQSETGTAHTAGLTILGKNCQEAPDGKFFCQIGFKTPTQSDDRVYLDAISVLQNKDESWKLLSGLCRK